MAAQVPSRRAVVDEDELAVDAADVEDVADARDQLGDVRLFVEAGDDDRQLHISGEASTAAPVGGAQRRFGGNSSFFFKV